MAPAAAAASGGQQPHALHVELEALGHLAELLLDEREDLVLVAEQLVLEIVGKDIGDVRVVFSGAGAAAESAKKIAELVHVLFP